MVFLCLLAGSLEIYDPLLHKDAGTVLRAIEEKTELPVTEWAETLTGQPIAKPKAREVYAPGTVGAVMDQMLAEKDAVEDAKALITLKNIQFQGVTILGDMELKELVTPYIGVPMSYEQMLDIGMTVESYYRKNNYLARAILPPQDLTDGVLTVDVIESVFSKIEVEQGLADMPNTQQHVTALIEAQQPTGELLNSKNLDRGLALANDLPGMLPEAVREERRARFMAVAEEVSIARLHQRVGSTLQVLVDSAPALGRRGGVGRSFGDAPEIDGVVRLLPPEKLSKTLKVGEFTRARIVRVEGHDLVGVPV